MLMLAVSCKYVVLLESLPDRFPLSTVFSFADEPRSSENNNNLSDSLRLYHLQPGAQRCNIILLIRAFELPTLTITSEENGCCVIVLSAGAHTACICAHQGVCAHLVQTVNEVNVTPTNWPISFCSFALQYDLNLCWRLLTLPLIFLLMHYFWYISADLFWHIAFLATDSLSDPITQKTSQWKVVALCINKVLFMSYQSDNSLTDVNVICTVLWPKTASSSPPSVIDKGAPSVTEHSSHFCYKKTVKYLMHRRSPGTAGILWRPYGQSGLCLFYF